MCRKSIEPFERQTSQTCNDNVERQMVGILELIELQLVYLQESYPREIVTRSPLCCLVSGC